MRFDILTLFPAMFPGYMSQSIVNKAIQRGLVAIHVHNMRDWAKGRHNKIDDTPYGCLLYTSPSPRDRQKSRMPSSA